MHKIASKNFYGHFSDVGQIRVIFDFFLMFFNMLGCLVIFREFHEIYIF